MKGAPVTLEAAEVRGLRPGEFEAFRKLAMEKFGLDLRQGKQELVAARLGKQLRRLHLRSFEEYYRYIVEDPSGEALVGMIDALTTNHTSFLREPAHFDLLRETIMPDLIRRDTLTVWSAACATGEEAYSIAFSVLVTWPDVSRLRITATDISTRALAAAAQGVYPSERFREVPVEWQRRFLLRGQGRWEGWHRVRPEIRRVVEFRRLNLIEPYSHPAPFPVVFCRNVMIYFDRPTQEKVVDRISQWIEPGGYLLIGHAESLTGLRHGLSYVCPAVYRKPGGCGRATSRGRS